jgi:peptidoglycan hydrolase CwlO-like protein
MPKTHRPGTEDQISQDGPDTEPPDPNERLKQLQNELTEQNNRIAHLSKQAGALQTDIADLTATVQQVDTAVTTYGAGLADLHHRLHALHYFSDQKSKMIHAAIGDRKGPIDELIRDFDLEIARMKERLAELLESKNTAQRESDKAAELQKSREAEYEFVIGTQKRLTKHLAAMESLRADITKADDQTDVATMYFLMLEFHHTLAETKVISQHELYLELRQRLGELESAKEHARAKGAALSSAQAEYTNHHTALEAKQQGRRDKLLAHVQKMFPVPESSTDSDSTQAQRTAETTASTGASSPTPGAAISAPAAPASTISSAGSQTK